MMKNNNETPLVIALVVLSLFYMLIVISCGLLKLENEGLKDIVQHQGDEIIRMREVCGI